MFCSPVVGLQNHFVCHNLATSIYTRQVGDMNEIRHRGSSGIYYYYYYYYYLLQLAVVLTLVTNMNKYT
jgi:hypothetical protein